MEQKPKTLNQKKYNYFSTNTNGKDTTNGKKLSFSNAKGKVSLKTLPSSKRQAKVTSPKFIKHAKTQRAGYMRPKRSLNIDWKTQKTRQPFKIKLSSSGYLTTKISLNYMEFTSKTKSYIYSSKISRAPPINSTFPTNANKTKATSQRTTSPESCAKSSKPSDTCQSVGFFIGI